MTGHNQQVLKFLKFQQATKVPALRAQASNMPVLRAQMHLEN
jgi:hypothetical protein